MMLPGSSTKAAPRLGCTRQALFRLLNGKAGISPAIALALERIGWSNASFRMRLQASYELAQARLDWAVAERRARTARMIGSLGSIPAWAGSPRPALFPPTGRASATGQRADPYAACGHAGGARACGQEQGRLR